MNLRKHQLEFKNVIDGIISGSDIKNIYCHCTPGSGKSLLPVIAGTLIEAGRADKLMWVAPRLSLLDQGERQFIDPLWRKLLNHQLQIRSSTNENNPSRGLHGFCTTMQAVGVDEGILLNEFRQRRYILILDEGHHIAVGSSWESKFKELWDMATYRIFLSGTLERGDGERISFLPYKQNGAGLVPDLRNTKDTAIIIYNRTDALSEKAIIPLSFHLSDGKAEWQEPSGKKRSIASMDSMNEMYAAKAIYTALNTEYAEDLLKAGLDHWLSYKTKNPGATCLIVCSDIKQAKRHTETLKRWGFCDFDIATSDDSSQALKAIKKLKSGKIKILVVVAMAYEGMDCPSVSHIICLTRIRSNPWIIQMTARANRIDKNGGPYDEQIGYVFAPADPLFKTIVERIEREQLAAAQDKKARTEKEDRAGSEAGDGFSLQPAPGGIVPLSSKLTGKKEILLSGNGSGGQLNIDIMPERTSSEIEADLLERIDSHIRSYAFQNRYHPKKINYEVFQYFGKKRAEMTIKELENCLKWIKANYPLTRTRGTGIPRVATKAAPYQCEWRQG